MNVDLDTVREVVLARRRADLAQVGAGSAVLAGGTFLYSEPHDHLDRLVDITTLGWPSLVETAEGLEIAATCTLAEFAGARPGQELGSKTLRPDWPGTELFARACRALLASHKIWRTATVGGNVCLSLPAGAVLGALVALDADAVVWPHEGGERRIALRDFVSGPGTNVLPSGSVVRSFVVALRNLHARTSFRKIALAPLGRSGCVVMGRRTADACALTITAATTRPVVLEFGGPPSVDALASALAEIPPNTWFDDPHGAPDWRRHVTHLLATEVVADLAEGRS
ncbi:FAD binding domain-containing protein [Nocardia sp. NPDC023988]|uniref:FAD binding domain-containing protein n=1 Tax=unclassified Nocardia TaxID=2637762 RepID=UPI00340F8700